MNSSGSIRCCEWKLKGILIFIFTAALLYCLLHSAKRAKHGATWRVTWRKDVIFLIIGDIYKISRTEERSFGVFFHRISFSNLPITFKIQCSSMLYLSLCMNILHRIRSISPSFSTLILFSDVGAITIYLSRTITSRLYPARFDRANI